MMSIDLLLVELTMLFHGWILSATNQTLNSFLSKRLLCCVLTSCNNSHVIRVGLRPDTKASAHISEWCSSGFSFSSNSRNDHHFLSVSMCMCLSSNKHSDKQNQYWLNRFMRCGCAEQHSKHTQFYCTAISNIEM